MVCRLIGLRAASKAPAKRSKGDQVDMLLELAEDDRMILRRLESRF